MSKTVFVSGATSGIGLATVKKLHALGWKIYAGGLQGDNFLQLEYGITQLPFDIADPDGADGAVKLMQLEIDHLDAIVNNAGISIAGPLEALSMEQIRRQFDVNFFGHLQVIKAMLPLLRKSNSARIVNVSSLAGLVAMPLLGAYGISKHALEAMSDVLRMELKPLGIHVAVVEPGTIQTPLTQSAVEELESIRSKSFPEIQSDYAAYFDGMEKTLRTQAKNAKSPDKIADKIIHALTSDKPKARYIVGTEVAGLSTIRKFLPESLGDWFLLRILGIK